VEAKVRVRYAETDQMGIVYHANYVVWMEVGRVELCRALGIRYRDMEAEGILLTVVEVQCRYAQPALYDEEIVIRAWVEESNPRMVRFGYEMREAESGRKVATGETKHIFCDKSRKPRKLPEQYRESFGMAARGAE
jgi:acyl-CoA thioester hydrolase